MGYLVMEAAKSNQEELAIKLSAQLEEYLRAAGCVPQQSPVLHRGALRGLDLLEGNAEVVQS